MTDTSPDASRRCRLRVRYADTDRMGIAYYANYLVWFEVGRTEWLRDTGWSYREMEQEGVALPVIEAHCEYRQPARYDDEVEIATRATLVTPVRIRFDYQVTRTADGVLSAAGHTVHAALDAAGKPCRLPPRVREMLPVADDPGTPGGSRGAA
ncbi:MAG: acyl-CoA thioesterase [Acidobacteria bacterium]|nr:acyl-CoA thioesterase [Acidobacteriota bacterium]